MAKKNALLPSSVIALALVASSSLVSAQDAPATAASAQGTPSAGGVTTPVPASIVEPVRDLALTLAPPVLGPSVVSDGHWRGGILFDEAFRSAIRFSAVEDQEIARHVSDVLLLTVPVMALVDGLATPLAQGNPELALRTTFAHVLAMGITLGAGEIVKRAAGRARPFERDCAEDPTRRGCDDGDIFSSFYSLHSGVTFTSAGYMCSVHAVRGLYGNSAADATACGVSLAMAATTGLLRVVSDRHYISDVLVGAALGFLVGFLVPLAIVPDVQHGEPQGAAVTRHTLEGPPPVMIGPTFSGRF